MLVTAEDMAGRIKVRLAEMNAEAQTNIAQGLPADYAAYREFVGKLSVIRQIDDEINHLMKHRD